MLAIEPRTSQLLNTCLTTELHPQSLWNFTCEIVCIYYQSLGAVILCIGTAKNSLKEPLNTRIKQRARKQPQNEWPTTWTYTLIHFQYTGGRMKFRTKLINQNRQSTNFICHCTRNLKTLKNSVLKIKVIHSQPGLQNKTSPQINKQDKIKKISNCNCWEYQIKKHIPLKWETDAFSANTLLLPDTMTRDDVTLLATSSVTSLIFFLTSSVRRFIWFRMKSSLSIWSSLSSIE